MLVNGAMEIILGLVDSYSPSRFERLLEDMSTGLQVLTMFSKLG